MWKYCISDCISKHLETLEAALGKALVQEWKLREAGGPLEVLTDELNHVWETYINIL